MDDVRRVGVHVRSGAQHEGEHGEAGVARGAARGAQSRGSATAERRPGCVLGAGACGARGAGCAAPGACVGQLSAKEEPVRHACSEEASWAWE